MGVGGDAVMRFGIDLGLSSRGSMTAFQIEPLQLGADCRSGRAHGLAI